MSTARRFGFVLVGLLFAVQGTVAAAKPLAIAPASDTDAVHMAADMPCAGMAQDDGTDMGCCDADCPGMLSCLLGSAAVAGDAAPAASAGTQPPDSPKATSTRAALPTSPLRPPIALHG